MSPFDPQIRTVRRMLFGFTIMWILLGMGSIWLAAVNTYRFWQTSNLLQAFGALVCFANIGFSIHMGRGNIYWCKKTLAKLEHLQNLTK